MTWNVSSGTLDLTIPIFIPREFDVWYLHLSFPVFCSSWLTASCPVFVDLRHHLFVLPGKEDKTVEGASEDLLAIGGRKLCTNIGVLQSNEYAESIKQRTRNWVRENGKHRTLHKDPGMCQYYSSGMVAVKTDVDKNLWILFGMAKNFTKTKSRQLWLKPKLKFINFCRLHLNDSKNYNEWLKDTGTRHRRVWQLYIFRVFLAFFVHLIRTAIFIFITRRPSLKLVFSLSAKKFCYQHYGHFLIVFMVWLIVLIFVTVWMFLV